MSSPTRAGVNGSAVNGALDGTRAKALELFQEIFGRELANDPSDSTGAAARAIRIAGGQPASIIPPSPRTENDDSPLMRTPRRASRRQRSSTPPPVDNAAQHQRRPLCMLFSDYVDSMERAFHEIKPRLADKGIDMLNKFSGDDQAMQFRMVHQDLIAYADPTVLVIGINPTVRASHPLDANTPSGELVHRWIRGVPRDVRVMLWNIVPGLTFTTTANRSEISYDVVFNREQQLLAKIHRLSMDFIQHAAQHMPALKRIITLGRKPLEWLKQIQLPLRILVLGSAHPAHYLRLQPPRPDVFLKFMQACVDQSGEQWGEPETGTRLWFDPLLIHFVAENAVLQRRILLKMLSLDLAQQRLVVLAGSVNKPDIFRDATGVMIGSIQKAQAGDPESIRKFVDLPGLQEHVCWRFLELTASQQRRVMSRSCDGCRSLNAVIWKRMDDLSR